jgi:bile acid:Na+ symporter, BASS family
MPVAGAIPEPVLAVVAAATVFTVMLTIGLGIVLGEFRSVWGNPGLVVRGLFSVLIAVPVIAVIVTHALELPRLADIGVVLMAISPGAPVALRRSLGGGGHRSLAPALQILVALLAVASMPLSIVALNLLYAGHASIQPAPLARQVFMAQLLPLGLGVLLRRAAPAVANRIEPGLARLGTALLIALATMALINVWRVVVDAGPRVAFAIAVVTALSLATGHALGGPEPSTRTAVAISSAARNPGLALLAATLNHAPPEIGKTVFAYLIISAITVLPYVVWRRRTALSMRNGRFTTA